MTQLTCFKAYDIRGELGEELNEDIAYRIGRAYGEFLKPGKIVVGGDVRLTSESLKLALARGLMAARKRFTSPPSTSGWTAASR